MRTSSDPSPYAATARAAHDMADLLKRVRPELRPQTEELQAIMMRAHDRLRQIGRLQEGDTYLGGSSSVTLDVRDSEVAMALNDLEAAYQTLWEMKSARKTVPVSLSAAPGAEFIETRFTA